ncbi:hypothetical protein [Brucella intermedia]|uniref:hypothetical protein n=1 Tax=Brucella intermedia TaxID=94625 RepID=UPI000468933D|nr:hypothetical protein [Brucella intermedia]
MGPKWQAYQTAKQHRLEAEGWIKHIGAKGRHYDGKTATLGLSRVHASVKLTVAGQYSEGGNNYRESPAPFNKMLIEVIHDNFSEIRDEVLKRLRAIESAALIEAKTEVETALSDIEKAESEAA